MCLRGLQRLCQGLPSRLSAPRAAAQSRSTLGGCGRSVSLFAGAHSQAGCWLGSGRPCHILGPWCWSPQWGDPWACDEKSWGGKAGPGARPSPSLRGDLGARGSVPARSAGSSSCRRCSSSRCWTCRRVHLSRTPVRPSGSRGPPRRRLAWPSRALALWPSGLSPPAGARRPGCSQVPAGAPSRSSAHPGAGGPGLGVFCYEMSLPRAQTVQPRTPGVSA